MSVATSLAIEGLVGVGLDGNGSVKKTPNRTKEFEKVWINVRTLIRNVIGSVSDRSIESIRPDHIAFTVMEDIGAIEEALKVYGPHLKLQLYYCEYRFIQRSFPNALLREPSTVKQKTYNEVSERAWNFTRTLIQDSEYAFKNYMKTIEGNYMEKVLMLSHFPIDLLSYKQFRELSLLESHTGAIKTRPYWYTKLYNGKDLSIIPFNELTLQVYGDNETFRPTSIKLRRLLTDIAISNKWSYLTTVDKIRYNLNSIKDPVSKEELKKYL